MKKYLLLAIPALITAMSASSQELKTYSGPFTIKGLHIDGKATYTYCDAEDGTRIFHGEFNLENDYNKRVHGRFTDNKQTGIWIFNFDDYYTYTINFNNEGCPEGEISYTKGDGFVSYNIKDGVANGPVRISYGGENKLTTFSMSNGVADGLYTETEDGKVVSTGMFANGKPVGKWTSSDGIYTAYFDDNGELKYVVDETTGDKSQYMNFGIPDPKIPEFSYHYRYQPEKFLMRDSKLKPETSNNSDNPAIDMSGKIYDAVEQHAQFPGGTNALIEWLCNNLCYPEISKENGVQGRVIVQFVVERDGSISNPTVVRGVDKDLDEEALRIVRKMPRWQPGKSNGVAVRSRYVLPISFKLANAK